MEYSLYCCSGAWIDNGGTAMTDVTLNKNIHFVTVPVIQIECSADRLKSVDLVHIK